jgi:hypothetical protein
MAGRHHQSPERLTTMQAQTTRKLNGNFQKLAGGLLIAAALAAGTIGLTSFDKLDIPGTASNTVSITAPVSDRHFAPYFGEGLPRFDETSTAAVDQVRISRQIEVPQGEGYPLAREVAEIVAQPAGQASSVRQFDAPQGEGYPLIELEQSAQQFTPLGEGLVMGTGE